MSEQELEKMAEEMELIAEIEAVMCQVMEILGDVVTSGMLK